MAENRPMGTFELCADIRMSQSVDLSHLVGPGSALSKVPSLPRCDRALGRFLIDTKNCPFFKKKKVFDVSPRRHVRSSEVAVEARMTSSTQDQKPQMASSFFFWQGLNRLLKSS
jgi:hypothetical protein